MLRTSKISSSINFFIRLYQTFQFSPVFVLNNFGSKSLQRTLAVQQCDTFQSRISDLIHRPLQLYTDQKSTPTGSFEL